MARIVTLAQLRTALEREADLPVITDATYITLSEARDYLNEAIHDLTGILAECYPSGYFDRDIVLTTSAGSPTTALPDNFYQLRRISHQVGGDYGRHYPLCEWRDTRDMFDRAPRTWSAGTVIRYRLHADTVELDPVPAENGYRLWLTYVPVLADLVEDYDEFDGRAAWDRWVVLTAAIRVMDRQEQDASQKRALLAEIERRIRFHAPVRDGQRIARIRNLDAARGRDWDDEGEWSSGR